jgi:hypothetical protein
MMIRPFYKSSRQTRYVELGGKQYNLNSSFPDRPRLGPGDEEEALERYIELKKLLRRQQLPEQPRAVADHTVLAVVQRFLDWVKEYRAPRCYEWYQWRLQCFCDSIDASLKAADVKHFHLDDFLSSHPEWKSGTKHGMARAVMRAFCWAKKKGHIPSNPIADYEKPRPGRRTTAIAPETIQHMLELAGSTAFRDLLEFTWETAARPQESLAGIMHRCS